MCHNLQFDTSWKYTEYRVITSFCYGAFCYVLPRRSSHFNYRSLRLSWMFHNVTGVICYGFQFSKWGVRAIVLNTSVSVTCHHFRLNYRRINVNSNLVVSRRSELSGRMFQKHLLNSMNRLTDWFGNNLIGNNNKLNLVWFLIKKKIVILSRKL